MEKEEEKKKRANPVLIFLILLVIVFFILGLGYRGYIDFSKFGISFGNNSNINNNSVNYSPGTCPQTSCQAGPGNSCCYATEADRVAGTRSVAAVLVRDYCPCPTDTNYSGVTDIHSEGGPWKICDCN
jgi:hypothetical protein